MYPTFPLISHIIIENDNKILLFNRNNCAVYKNYWALPGGKVEYGEHPSNTAVREAYEELGIVVTKIEFISAFAFKTNLIENDQKKSDDQKYWQDINFFFRVIEYKNDIVNKESHKHADLKFFDYNELPSPLTPSTESGIKMLKSNTFYFEQDLLP